MKPIKRFFIRFAAKRLKWFVRFWYNTTVMLTRKPKIKLPAFVTVREIAEVMKEASDKWRPDPLGGALDVCMHPTKFQMKLAEDKEKLGDCDDYAMYWCACLLENELVSDVYFASAFYEDSNGKIGGHAVCLFQFPYDTNYYWADYGVPKKLESLWDFAPAIANQYGGKAITGTYYNIKYIKRTKTPRLKRSFSKVY